MNDESEIMAKAKAKASKSGPKPQREAKRKPESPSPRSSTRAEREHEERVQRALARQRALPNPLAYPRADEAPILLVGRGDFWCAYVKARPRGAF